MKGSERTAEQGAACAQGPRVLLLALCASFACRSPEFAEQVDWPPPKTGMVVSEHPLATQAGVRMLEQGGNAADAAVAAALTLAVVYPQAGNLGGGGFALWVPHGEAATALDFRETAPALAQAELFLDENGLLDPRRSLCSPLGVGVPGSPAGLHALHRRFGSGRFQWSTLCEDAIRLAAEGFEVDAWLARDLLAPGTRARLTADPAAAALFYPGGEALREGALLRQSELAATLRTLAARGPEGFYRGAVAEAIVAALAAAAERGAVPASACLTLEDLASYRVVERVPLSGWFRGSEVLSMGPPSSGGVALLQVLAMLEGFPLDAARGAAGEEEPARGSFPQDRAALSAQAVHWWIEAMRRAFADRAAHLGDSDFVPVPLAELLSPGWSARRRISIGMRADLDVGAWVAPPGPESSETTHISVIDRRGNAVSLTTTLNESFGSGILVPGAGFLLNDELDDFALAPGQPNLFGLVGGAANALAPGKRPLSSMTPTVVREGGRRVTIVLGSPDGPRIITAVTQVLLRVLVYGQSLQEAVRAPRLHQQWKPAVTRFESGWEPTLLEALARDHGQPIDVLRDERFGSVQAILVQPDGIPVGVSDPRRGGTAQAEDGAPTPRAHPNDPWLPQLEDAALHGH